MHDIGESYEYLRDLLGLTLVEIIERSVSFLDLTDENNNENII